MAIKLSKADLEKIVFRFENGQRCSEIVEVLFMACPKNKESKKQYEYAVSSYLTKHYGVRSLEEARRKVMREQYAEIQRLKKELKK